MRRDARFPVVAALLLSFALGVLSSPLRADEKDDQYYELMKTFVDTFEQIERNYVKEVDRRQLLEAAIRGMVSELDQYSDYIGPEDLARFTQEVEREFGGVGIQVQIDPQTKRLTVISPLPGTPAYKAGIRAGDTIMEIEGQSTEGFKIADAVKLLKGEPGEKVTMGIRHVDSNEIEQVTVERAIIRVSTVLGDTFLKEDKWNFMLDDEKKIGYVRLTHFSRHSSEELHEALNELTEAGMKGLILDLRFNPGGLLSQATDIADMFIESGKIVSTEGRNSRPREWTATKAGTYSGFPMVVLVNRYSASASEIVSACLQDHKRAIVIGERSWGKGSVQNVIDLESGSSALKLTTASYHRPSGKNIHRFPGAKEEDEWGVMPSEGMEVKFSSKEMQDYLVYRRDRDVITEGAPPKSDFKDRQLDKAIEVMVAELSRKDEPGRTGENATEKPADGEKPKAEKSESEKKMEPEKSKKEEKSQSQRREIRFLPVVPA